MALTNLVAGVLSAVGVLLGVYMLWESWATAVAAAVAVVVADVAFVCIAIRKGTPVGQVYSRWTRRWQTREI